MKKLPHMGVFLFMLFFIKSINRKSFRQFLLIRLLLPHVAEFI